MDAIRGGIYSVHRGGGGLGLLRVPNLLLVPGPMSFGGVGMPYPWDSLPLDIIPLSGKIRVLFASNFKSINVNQVKIPSLK